jgi:inositol polyphosphate 5-phosphatase INPP5B/F
MFCGTYNVNGKAKVDSDGLSDWMFHSGIPAHDIYALGFQEIVELTPVNVATDMMGPQRTQFWVEQINACFKKHSTEAYVCIGVRNLVGILLCVYIRQSLFNFVSDVRWSTTAVGIMGVMGNKGGVVMRFNIHSTGICIVCAHLAASRDNVTARNSDYRNIMERTLLERAPRDVKPQAQQGAWTADRTGMAHHMPGSEGSLGDALLGILDHDIVFWIGDFNYRIDLSLSQDDIMTLLQYDNLAVLRKKDQLNIERAAGNVFHDFEEGVLTFPPTYKFQPGTDVYETRPEKKLRPPAWCDRVLWREPTNKGADRSVQQTSYKMSKLRTSDHKPVSSTFNLQTRVVDPQREKTQYMKHVRDLDRMENEEQPRVEVGPSLEINIADVCFQVSIVFFLHGDM